MEKHYTLAQAAELLGVSTQTIRLWDRAGKINNVRTPGNQRRVPHSEIERLQSGGELQVGAASVQPQAAGKQVTDGGSMLLMCKDVAVYDVLREKVLDDRLVPGAIAKGTLDFRAWMKTRRSGRSNTEARRLMLRAFGSDNHESICDATRTLSLTDCYWLKKEDESVSFNDVTPYLHAEWDGTGVYAGGSLSTLYTGGALSKRWLDSKTLLKKSSQDELEVYMLCESLHLKNVAVAGAFDTGIKLANFTSPGAFFESMEQSGANMGKENPREKAIDAFKGVAVVLFVIDYFVENDDRHCGSYGYMRDSNTGEYMQMAPYFGFDGAWSGGSIVLPESALKMYSELVRGICMRAKQVTGKFAHGAVILKRADELLNMLTV